jgi:hypothetical protein
MIKSTQVKYIKLGSKSSYEEKSFNEGILLLGYHEVKDQYCIDRETLINECKNQPSLKSKAADHARQIYDFYNAPEDTIWITFANGYMYWCQVEEDVHIISYDDEGEGKYGSRFRKTINGWSIFSVLAGRDGLLVLFDEMVNLYKLSNTKARKNNYEQLLRIINDTLQGNAKNLGFVMGGTPDFLIDGFRGLYSYEALKSRLEENRFAVEGLIDFDSPVISLQNLAPEDLYILLQNIRNVFASGDESKYLVPDECLKAFMEHCNKNIGAEYFKTPRNTIKEFVSLLSILEQNPSAKWQDLLGKVTVEHDKGDSTDVIDDESDEEDLASFSL